MSQDASGPVARVLVDTGLAHLDRDFEYAVPPEFDATARPGVRVKVRFAGKDRDGFVIDRPAQAEHVGKLTPLRRVVSDEPVLTPAVLAAATRVAESLGGTRSDVLRLAIPPRHARAEAALDHEPPPTAARADWSVSAWAPFEAGQAYLRRVADGQHPRASVLALPGQPAATDWPRLLAEAVRACVDGGRRAVVVVPDHRDVARVAEAVGALIPAERVVRLTARMGPQARYTAFLKALRGFADVVVGTRGAAFAPLADLGLLAWWDDGDDLLDEPRAPYPSVREILLARADVEGAALCSAGFVRSVAMTEAVRRGEVVPVTAPRGAVRASAPAVRVAGEGRGHDDDPVAARAHLPTLAWRTAKAALADGPVLVQVPRRGYLPATSCASCRRPARCRACAGPLAVTQPGATPSCRWCGALEPNFACPACESRELRSSVVGARRTAEELGRAFPGVPVERSGADAILDAVPPGPRLVIATPGAEPIAPDGYAAALLLDAWALLDRASLDAGEEALRRWCAAAALVRPAACGGAVVLAGAPVGATIPAIEALVRWDPAWFAERELAERADLGLPPAAAMVRLTGSRPALDAALREADLPPDARILGPLPAGEGHRVLITAPPQRSGALAAQAAAVRSRQSARKDPDPVAIQVNPRDPTG